MDELNGLLILEYGIRALGFAGADEQWKEQRFCHITQDLTIILTNTHLFPATWLNGFLKVQAGMSASITTVKILDASVYMLILGYILQTNYDRQLARIQNYLLSIGFLQLLALT